MKCFVKLNAESKKWVFKVKVPGLVFMFKRLDGKRKAEGASESQSNLRLKYYELVWRNVS